MSITSFNNLVAAFNLDSDGFSATDNRFTDISGNGRHLPVISGAPIFTTLLGKESLANPSSSSFVSFMNNPVPIFGAAICVINHSITNDISRVLQWDSFDVPAGQHNTSLDPEGNTVPKYDISSAGNPQRNLIITNGNTAYGMVSGKVISNPIVKETWNIILIGTSSITGRHYSKVNNGDIKYSDEPTNINLAYPVEGQVGFFGNQLDLDVAKYINIARLGFIRDDLDINQSDTTDQYIQELMTEFGIT